jgi:hypothetical protein
MHKLLATMNGIPARLLHSLVSIIMSNGDHLDYLTIRASRSVPTVIREYPLEQCIMASCIHAISSDYSDQLASLV